MLIEAKLKVSDHYHCNAQSAFEMHWDWYAKPDIYNVIFMMK